MAKSRARPYDTTCKDLVELRPRDVLALAGVTEILDARLVDADLATIISAADKVLRVRTPDGEFIVHFEFQSGRDSDLADRIFWYNAALCHRHGLAVQTVVVLLAPAADVHTLTGTRSFALPNGRECLRFHYDVIRLWQTPAETILNGPVGLLPLAPLCSSVDPIERVIGRMDRRISVEATRRESETLWAATYFLMGLHFDAAFVRELIPKGEAMKESTTYQATLEEGRIEGRQAGRQEGRQAGRQEGRQEEAVRLLLRLGQKTLGIPGARFREQLAAMADVDEIESLIERVGEVASWDQLLPKKARKKKS
jgi:predicted transposase YdaD